MSWTDLHFPVLLTSSGFHAIRSAAYTPAAVPTAPSTMSLPLKLSTALRSCISFKTISAKDVPTAIQRAQADIRDANGALLEDCHPVSTDPQGAFIFGFGIASAACDTAVSQRITVVYDNEVRL